VEPYISLVVTARNDDHGGNLLGRMQIFVNGWIAQSRRHNLASELIIVEWNPPTDRPRLREALRWPADLGLCQVRFIEVPRELHRCYSHADALPLYQMIAKNVGIRRTRGQFILATNIDILFSDELVAFLAERRLDPGRMYRIDRHDAMGDVPLDATPGQQLDYCREHVLRINSRYGTFLFDAPPAPTLSPEGAVSDGRKHMPSLWSRLQGLIDRIASDSPVVTVTFPNAAALRRIAAWYVDCGGFTGMLRHGFVRKERPLLNKVEPEIPLHTNACGDFTLAARKQWLRLRGYPEFDLYSMNIDSAFCYCAHHAGVRELVLEDPLRIYHIEHAVGSGWTPEGQAQLFERLAAKGVGHLPFSDVAVWAEQMRRLNCTMIFNDEDWGLANFDLVETAPPAGMHQSERAVSEPA
jgi:hypothetical protein